MLNPVGDCFICVINLSFELCNDLVEPSLIEDALLQASFCLSHSCYIDTLFQSFQVLARIQ